jgi:hypothetical protein
MRYTKYTAKLPTRTTLRDTAATLRTTAHRARDDAGDYATTAVLVCIAAAAIVTGAMGVGLTLSAVLTALPDHQLALLAATATTLVALYALPLLALVAVDPALRALERRV